MSSSSQTKPLTVLGCVEISTMLGISTVRARQLTNSRGFPAPLAILTQGRVWSTTQVERWAQKAGRTTQPVYARFTDEEWIAL